MTGRAESVVLVEGFDDRDFWKGLLLRQQCREARTEPPALHRQRVGFTYVTPSGALVHVVPYKAPQPGHAAGAELADVAELKLKERKNKPLRRLVLAPDADAHDTLDAAHASVRAFITSRCPDATVTPNGDFLIDGGALVVSTLLVHAGYVRAGDGLPVGVPEQPALEQLACAALCRVYPDRGAAVAGWLATRPARLGKEHKAHAWSFYAGWTTDHGTGDFYGSLWRDDRVAVVLEELLRTQGAWRVIEALLHS